MFIFLNVHIFKCSYENVAELDSCCKITTIAGHSHLTKCTMCPNRGHHNMRVRYLCCGNEACNKNGVECPRRMKVSICLKRDDPKYQPVNLYSNNVKHNSTIFQYKRHGITETVKELIEVCIYNYTSTPKAIHIRLFTKVS